MAQTKLTLEDSTGNRISTPGIKSFAIGTDNNLVIYLDQPFNFTDLLPDISVDATSGSGCTVSAPASVTTTQPAAGTSRPISFKVTSATSGATLSLVVDPEGRTPLPASSPSPFTFPSWDIGGATPAAVGSYLAVFQATDKATPPHTSQLVVMIKINPGETVTPPTAISPLTGTVNQGINFTASGATVSTAGHTVEYRFDWGDGSGISSYSSAQSHTYTSANTFTIKAQARCVTDLVESTWYSTSITISNAPTETVSTPGTPSGTTSGTVNTQYNYTTTGATSNLGHTVEYRFNWGGGDYSDWSTSTNFTKSWSAAGTYSVTVEARCQQHQSISSVSSALSVTIAPTPAETVSTPGTPSGTTSGTVNTSYTYTTTGATSSLQHTVEYRFNWGDGNSSSWSTSTNATKSWSSASTYSVTVEARCQTHTSISSLSSALSVNISSGGGGGAPGTKTNPIKINKPTTKVASGYIPSISPENGRGAVKVPVGQKAYFEVDPLATTDRSVIGFGVSVKFYSGMGAVCKLTQDKATLAYSSEVCRGSTSYIDTVYDNQPYEVDNTRFLYAIDNSSGAAEASDEIWATIP
jgi:uncharacterized protein YcfL